MSGINGNTKIAGVIGDPVAHTLSPVIHNTLAKKLGVNLCYLPFHVKGEKLEDSIKGAYGLDILGLNVTVPHKQAVMNLLADIDESACAIGAVNTLVRTGTEIQSTDRNENDTYSPDNIKKQKDNRKDGFHGYLGYNTDWLGLGRALDVEGIFLKGAKVLLMGAGGAAHAAAYLCGKKKASEVTILCRRPEQGKALGDRMQVLFSETDYRVCRFQEWQTIPGNGYVCIQTTPVGMTPHDGTAVIEEPAFYAKLDAAMDVVYSPANTRFMQLAKEAGSKKVCNGLMMLLYQAVEAFELFTGAEVTEDAEAAAKEQLTRLIYPIRNKVLIGFMGSGKTAVSKKLSQRLGYKWIDTDEKIEQEQEMCISQIFDVYGEAYFRQLETELLLHLAKEQEPMVISTGGGLAVQPQNREPLKALGDVVLLNVKPETVLKRLSGDESRPLLQGADKAQRVQTLLQERMPAYIAAADYIVNTDEKTPVQIAEEILHCPNECKDK